ncbi:MAG: MBL fold metallo-hydrolase [Acidobacteriota bacterium]
MILEQLYLGCLSQASYFVADPEGDALVVDPRRDVDVYLELAERHGRPITRVALTHFHADFLAGHLELAERTGARLHLGARAQAEFDFTALADEATMELGPSVTVRVLETPGHTPESVCYAIHDRASDGPDPHAVLTGDTLFNGDVGRPDLLVGTGWSAEDLARLHYQSLQEKLLSLPDETLVYPGHGPGSACGKSLSGDTVTTIGAQRTSNPALTLPDVEAFVARACAGQGAAPAYFVHDAAWNAQARQPLASVLEAARRPLERDEVLQLRDEGASVLDVRDVDAAAAGCLVGSTWVGLEGRFASWAGSVVDLERPLVLLVEPERVDEAATRLGRIGLDTVVGHLAGGPAALATDDAELQFWERLSATSVQELLASDAPPQVLDVRGPGEVAEGAIAGSLHVPLVELPARLEEVAATLGEQPTVVTCGSGYRSAIACSLLRQAGVSSVAELAGGHAAWLAAGGAVVVPADVASS